MKSLIAYAFGIMLSASIATSSFANTVTVKEKIACGDEANCKGHKKACCKDKNAKNCSKEEKAKCHDKAGDSKSKTEAKK